MFGFVLNANRLFSDLKDKWGGGAVSDVLTLQVKRMRKLQWV